ncbi:hypothetical protein PMAYCL1PPCAC_10384, partial [Pristionchus mayeri]
EAVPILAIVGPTPGKQQLDILFEVIPQLSFHAIISIVVQVLSDIEVVPMNCSAFISHKKNRRITHSCNSPFCRDKEGNCAQLHQFRDQIERRDTASSGDHCSLS